MSEERKARLRITSGADPDDELLSLRAWLADEEQLRGRVGIDNSQVRSGEMGVAFDAVVVALGSGSVVTVLARAVPTWLKQRRSDVTVEITNPDGRTLKISAQRVAEAEAVIHEALLEMRPPEQER